MRINFKLGFAFFGLVLSSLALADVAADLAALQPGHWYEFPNSSLDAIDPNNDPVLNANFPGNASWHAQGGLPLLMGAWNGGVYDTARDRLVVFGGGHRGYAGNEVYAFDIDTGAWERLSDPSTSIQESVGRYPDGLPTSRHSYNDIVYDAIHDRMVSVMASAAYCQCGSAPSFSAADAFDFATNTWSNLPDRPGGVRPGSWAEYHPTTGEIYAKTSLSSPLLSFDGQTNQWQQFSSSIGYPLYPHTAIDPTRNILVAVYKPDSNANGGVFVHDLNNPAASPIDPGPSGDLSLQRTRANGFVYDPVSDQFVGWGVGNTTDVFTLDPDTWVWTRRPAAPTNTVIPTAASLNGTYGRFQYSPSKNVFVLVNATSENVYAYKLSDGVDSPPAPSVNLSASPTSINPGASSLLTWQVTNATSCTASGDWSGAKNAAGGTETVSPTTTSTYTLSCSGAGGSADDSAVVTVGSPGAPGVALSASPSVVSSGDNSTLEWVVSGANSCIASGDWSGVRNAAGGSETIQNITSDRNFILTCNNAQGSAVDEVDVTVNDNIDDAYADWQIRSTAAGVIHAVGFDVESDVTNGMAGNLETRDHILWEQNNVASGDGALWFDILKTDGKDSGNWATWLDPDDTNFEFGPGEGFYISFRQYVPEYYALHDFLTDPIDQPRGFKQAILSRQPCSFDDSSDCGSNQKSELVLTNSGGNGVVQMYSQSSGFSARGLTEAVPSQDSPCASNDFLWQNAIDLGPQDQLVGMNPYSGLPYDDCDRFWARNGATFSYNIVRGKPYGKPNPIGGDFIYYPDEWVSYLMYVNIGTWNTESSTVKLWGAREAATEWTAIIDKDDVRVGNSSGPNYSGFWFTPYHTNRVPDPTREDTFTIYDELIISTQPIAVPQGLPPVIDNPQPTVSLTTSASTIDQGDSATLTWVVSDADTCTAGGGWSGSLIAAGDSDTVMPVSTTTYNITCTNAVGSDSDSVTVTVQPSGALAPVVNLQTDAINVNNNGSVTLSWAPENAIGCFATGSWFGGRPATGGTETFSNITANQSYSLTCQNSESVRASEVVNVAVNGVSNPPSLTFSANPATVVSGGNTTLVWSSVNTTSCEASGDWTGVKLANGSEIQSGLTQNQSYLLTCTGPGGSTSAVVAVSVTAEIVTSESSGGGATGWWLILWISGLWVQRRWRYAANP